VNTTASHGHPGEDVPLREETLPILSIAVEFRDRGFRRAHQEPEGIELEMEPAPGGTRMVVPRIEVHSILVAEMERPGLLRRAMRPREGDQHDTSQPSSGFPCSGSWFLSSPQFTGPGSGGTSPPRNW